MIRTWMIALAALWMATAAQAGRSCEPQKLTAQTLIRGLNLAQATAEALEAEHARSGARVVILARAGQDLSRYRLRYSHLGFVWRAEDGRWRVLHKLNECGTPTGAVFRQGLGEFFLDDLWRYEAAWVVPTPEVQRQLLPLLADDRRAVALNHRPYSLVSYAWGQRYQQSNQWAIETLASAMEPGVQGRDAAQAWLKFKGYQPSTLQIGALTRLGGRMTAANVAFDDHPNEQRFADRIDTVTVDSVFQWLGRAGLSGPVVQLVR